MADYYPLIAHAVEGLDNNTGDNRRVLYERARAALVAQLRSFEPPLDESEITRERLSLEEAIRRIEADAGRLNRGESLFPKEPQEQQEPQERDAPAPTARPPYEDRASLRDEGLKDFRQEVREAESLGGEAAQASRSARDVRDVYGASFGGRDAETEHRDEPPFEPAKPDSSEQQFGEHPPYDTHADDDRSYDDRTHEDRGEPPAEPLYNPSRDDERSRFDPVEMHDPKEDEWAEAHPHASQDDDFHAYRKPRRDLRGPIRIAIILLLVGSVAAIGYWQRNNIGSMIASLRSPPAAPAPTAQPGTQARPKIADRIAPGGDNAPSASRPATAPAATAAQKVVLYEEVAGKPEGNRFVGSVLWRTETVSPGPGLAPELVVRADVDIPERKLRMTWTLRRNTDTTLPASHTIEIIFTLPPDFVGGTVSNIPGVLMKTGETARGAPLAGMAVKVTNGFFLIGLSAIESDVQRNMQMLKERPWFDVPIVYGNERRAILAVEKGAPGERVFEDAFRVWGP